MLKLSDEQKQEFADAVRIALATERTRELDAHYATFEVHRQARLPRCDQSGRCCRFEAFGHRLFVTTMEVARFVQTRQDIARVEPWDGQGCPYQIEGLCSVHSARPFGCRVYFCDPTSTQWQNGQYEQIHAAIRELHTTSGVPYMYVEWREALAAVGLASAGQAIASRLRIIS